MDLESTKINCNCILYVFNWFWSLNIITWNISMFKIQHVFQIKIFLCVPKAQITFIRSCVNRYSYWNKPCDSQFTQLSIKASSRMKENLYYFVDLIKDWFLRIILRVIICIFRNFQCTLLNFTLHFWILLNCDSFLNI